MSTCLATYDGFAASVRAPGGRQERTVFIIEGSRLQIALIVKAHARKCVSTFCASLSPRASLSGRWSYCRGGNSRAVWRPSWRRRAPLRFRAAPGVCGDALTLIRDFVIDRRTAESGGAVWTKLLGRDAAGVGPARTAEGDVIVLSRQGLHALDGSRGDIALRVTFGVRKQRR